MAIRRRSFWMGAIALCLLAAGVGGWWRLRHPPRRNVLFITLDTTRADHLGCYGYKKALTPTLDKIAAEGVLFERAYAPVPLTLPSHASMFTGLYPPEHGVRVNGRETLPEEIPTLAEILAHQGYKTGAFVSAFPLDKKFGLKQGFQTYSDELNDVKLDKGRQLRDADSVTGAALNWLQQNAQSPFLCWVHYYDPHHPYLDHSLEFGSRFKADPYDAEIAYVDRHIKRLRDFLEQNGLVENTLIVVVGDHGESLGEHQERRHSMMVYDATLHVPLLFRIPGQTGKMPPVSDLVSVIDLLPTILDTLGLPAQERISGLSLAHHFRNGERGVAGSTPVDRSIYGESIEPLVFRGWSPLHCLIHGKWKYIRSKIPELYDLEKDPGELHNLAKADPDHLSEMEERLASLEKKFVRRTATMAQLGAGDIWKLNDLGYTHSSDDRLPTAGGPDIKEMIAVANMVEDADALTESDPRRAEALARRALEVDPKYDSAVVVVGVALENQKRIEEAQKEYLKALTINPRAYMANFHLGNICVTRRDLPQAVARYQLALKDRPDAATIHANLGSVLLLLGQVQLATKHLQTAVELNPGNMSQRLSLADALAQTGQIDDAISEVNAALKFQPDSADAHGQLGMLLFRKGQTDTGFEHLRRAVELSPRNALLHYNLGVALEGTGRREEAIREFERALEIEPDDAVTKKSLQEARQALSRSVP